MNHEGNERRKALGCTEALRAKVVLMKTVPYFRTSRIKVRIKKDIE